MSSALLPIASSGPGARSNLSVARRRRLRRANPRRPGTACRPATGPKGHACTTGPISNWPISKLVNTTMILPVIGHEAFDQPQYHRRRSGLLLDLVSQRHASGNAGGGGRSPLGDRGQFRDRQERDRPGPQRNPLLARLAPPNLARHAGLCHGGSRPPPSQRHIDSQKNTAAPSNEASFLIRWSIQEIRRIANKLAQRRIPHAHTLAWSIWRRAHQAFARRAHLKRKTQL